MLQTGLPAPRSAMDIVADVRSGRSRARAEVEAALARIAERDALFGAFQVVRADAARREADAVDARDDKSELPLAGLPIAVKDNVAVPGEPLRAGSLATDTRPQVGEHDVVRRLRDAGAVVVGLTRLCELSVFGTTDSAFGVTRNPWDVTRTPGGSSGGSAAAVAAGMVPVAHGNDGMGSIRIPAACCGLVGIKPGYGVVPAGIGAGSWFDMAENGPLASTVADAALVLSVMAGRPELAGTSAPAALRVAVSTRAPLAAVRVDRSWRAAAATAAAVLREAGHTVRQATPDYNLRLGAAATARWCAGTELDARQVVDRRNLERRTRRHAALGRLLLRGGFPQPAGREAWQHRAEQFFADHDVLITPALAQSPPAAIEWHRRSWAANVVSNSRFAPFAAPWNLAGWPAITVPTGIGTDGLPRAAQLVARPGGEALLLGLAAQLEAARPWQRTAVLG